MYVCTMYLTRAYACVRELASKAHTQTREGSLSVYLYLLLSLLSVHLRVGIHLRPVYNASSYICVSLLVSLCPVDHECAPNCASVHGLVLSYLSLLNKLCATNLCSLTD